LETLLLEKVLLEKVLLVGYGDIARRLQGQLGGDYGCVGLRRSTVENATIDLRAGDIGEPETATRLLAEGFDVVVVTLTPDEISQQGYEHAYVRTARSLAAALAATEQRPRLVLWISSTSVYSQQHGEWVDETSPTEPSGFAGKALLQAETLLAAAPVDSVVVRCSGIYGPGRQRLIQQVRDGKGCAKAPVLFTNRIHADDVAGVLAHLIERHKQGEILQNCYLASDCEPVPLWEVKQWLAQQMGLPADHLAGDYPAGRRGSKRCSNQRLLDSGYRFSYPTFREGYGELIAIK
jgi:nucleoside-diphosphate-sugar epimerase